MLSWSDLEERFRSLKTPSPSIWIDHQTGDAADVWSVSSGGDIQARALFCEISAIAGRKLAGYLAEALPDRVKTEQNPMHRWFALLELSTASTDAGVVGEMKSPDGETVGLVATHRIDDPVRDSIRMCLRLGSLDSWGTASEPEEPGRFHWIWNVVTQNPLVVAIIAAIVGAVVTVILI